MKQLLLAAPTLLAVVASASDACAVPFDFTYTGSLVTFTVPTTGSYQILALGAQGGNTITAGAAGGSRGAKISGDFNLNAGEMLQIAVGGVGGPGVVLPGGIGSGGGGGGGSFVVGPGNTPLVIAGGGGGSGYFFGVGGAPPSGIPGQGGLTGPNGGGEGGTGGSGGRNGGGADGAGAEAAS